MPVDTDTREEGHSTAVWGTSEEARENLYRLHRMSPILPLLPLRQPQIPELELEKESVNRGGKAQRDCVAKGCLGDFSVYSRLCISWAAISHDDCTTCQNWVKASHDAPTPLIRVLAIEILVRKTAFLPVFTKRELASRGKFQCSYDLTHKVLSSCKGSL